MKQANANEKSILMVKWGNTGMAGQRETLLVVNDEDVVTRLLRLKL